MFFLVAIVLAALSISFLCSLLEAGLLSVSQGSLIAQKEKGHKGAAILLEFKEKRIDDAISAILTLNTIAHTLGAAISGAEAAHVFGDAWVGAFSGVLTLLILLLTEIVPKTLGNSHALKLASFTGHMIQALVWIMKPILFGTRRLTNLFAKEHKERVTSGEILGLVTMAYGQGTLTKEQYTLFNNLLAFDRLTLVEVMTPRTVIAMVSQEATLASLLHDRRIKAFSRIPLYAEDQDDVKGYILVKEVMLALAQGVNPERKLKAYLRKIKVLPRSFTIGKSLRSMLDSREHMALVLDEFGGVSGLVTMEDLVETILDVEIMDESDVIEDMRTRAIELRDQRLLRLGKKLEPTENGNDHEIEDNAS